MVSWLSRSSRSHRQSPRLLGQVAFWGSRTLGASADVCQASQGCEQLQATLLQLGRSSPPPFWMHLELQAEGQPGGSMFVEASKLLGNYGGYVGEAPLPASPFVVVAVSLFCRGHSVCRGVLQEEALLLLRQVGLFDAC